MNWKKLIIWVMIACQLAAWGWIQSRGGQLGDRAYLVFCLGMMLGQVGAGIECFAKKAWGTFVVQAYFFFFTVYGGVVRFLQMS